MIQPEGIIKFFSSVDETYENGFYQDIGVGRISILANNLRILPFQIQRAVSGDAITTFELLGIDIDDVSLAADIAFLVIREFKAVDSPPVTAFEQIIYSGQSDLSITIPSGFYKIHISDGTFDWYSNPIEIGNFPLAMYGFGGFADGFTDGFETEGAVLLAQTDNVILNFINFKDLGNKIYQFGFQDVLLLTEKHDVKINFNIGTQIIEKSEDTGKETIKNIYYQDEILISFFHTKDVVEFLRQTELLDKLTLVDLNQDQTEIKEFKVKIIDTDTEQIYKVEIRYKENYVNKNQCNVNY